MHFLPRWHESPTPFLRLVQGAALEAVALPSTASLVRLGQRARQATRPSEPKDPNFAIDLEHVPEPLEVLGDISDGNQRHILLASKKMVEYLSRARHWYVDGTFKIVGEPFTQLYSIHAFLKSTQGELKQVPLMFVLMTGKRKRDYKMVLRQVINILVMGNDLRSITADFEAGLWSACRSVFPGVQLHGCCFHFMQTMYRKLQALGLQQEYATVDATHQFCRYVTVCLNVFASC